MTQDRTEAQSTTRKIPAQIRLATSYYAMLGLHPSASPFQIRQAYRQLSKQYHPDTTNLPTEVATGKFQQLNEAYATLSNPELRWHYNLKIGYYSGDLPQNSSNLDHQAAAIQSPWSDSPYLEARDRPLSAGEVFVLFILGLTFAGCFALAITLAIVR